MSGNPGLGLSPCRSTSRKGGARADPCAGRSRFVYGHPGSGTFVERKCDERVVAVGLVALGPEW
eukprot:5776392-Lingulodinium_polyedra.AAC.1